MRRRPPPVWSKRALDRERAAGIRFSSRQSVDALRFLAAPPVSEDDLRTLSEGAGSARRTRAALHRKLATLLSAALDPIRMPWLAQGRPASSSERECAILWTTGVWAIERTRTWRRTESSRRQQKAVEQVLASSGHVLVPGRRTIQDLDVLERGSFTREVALAGSKCDLPVRLHDGRLLAIECKVSNSALNSVKRLIRETGGKADLWRREFGKAVIPAAVLAGVFKLQSLIDAQGEYGIAIFWQHDLEPLRRFTSQDA